MKAARLMDINHAGCIGHGLHLVVGTFLSIAEDKDGKEEADKTDKDWDDGVVDYPPVDLEKDINDISAEEKALANKVRGIMKGVKCIAKYLKTLQRYQVGS